MHVFFSLGVLILFLSLGELSLAQERDDIQIINTQQLYTFYRESIIFDVRTYAEYKKGHIPNAQWFDIEAIDFEHLLYSLDKEKTYIVYDTLGKRSIFVLHAMKKAGFTKLYLAKEGIDGWKKAGHRLMKET